MTPIPRPIAAAALVAGLASALPAAALDCASPAGTLDFGASRLHEVTGSATAPDSAQLYSCSADLHSGGEEVWELVLPADGRLVIQVRRGELDLSAFLLSACDESSCLQEARRGAAQCAEGLSAGTYWLVVEDGAVAGEPYELRLLFEEPVPNWQDCQVPVLPTVPSDLVSIEWSFDDFAHCLSDPANRNHPDGCTFALYAALDCGAELHLPFLDLESGQVRVFDLFTGEYLTIQGRTRGWFGSGEEIAWSHPDCPEVSPVNLDDPVDVIFGEEPACGLYRIEMGPMHAGQLWQLIANCDGSDLRLFPLAATTCAAMDLWNPLPDLTLEVLGEETPCPNYSVRYRVHNQGCTTSDPVSVWVVDSEDLSLVGTQEHPPIPPGGFSEALTPPTGFDHERLELVLDPNDEILECDETLTIACRSPIGSDREWIGGCIDPCTISVVVVPPEVRCADDTRRAIFDACDTVAFDCPGGELEFAARASGDTGPLLWGPSCLIDYGLPTATGSHRIFARCAANPDCLGIRDVATVVVPSPCVPECVTGEDVDDDGLAGCEDPDCLCEAAACPLLDCDSDGMLNGSDCSPGDAGAWLVPTEPMLRAERFADLGLRLTWTDPIPAAGNVGTHEVAADEIDALRAAGVADAACLQTGLAEPRLELPDPLPGSRYYLVRSVNACGPAATVGWGRDSRLAARPACP